MRKTESDTYRSVELADTNTTDSAVKFCLYQLKQQCQNERSQHRNKETCLKMLRLYSKKKRKKNQKELTNKTDIGWGHQIRSYDSLIN